jgi:PAS domain S-box-containing protein
MKTVVQLSCVTVSSSPAVVPSVLFERAWDAAPIGKAVIDVDGILILGNPALERMLEAEDGKLVGASLVEVVGELLLDPDALAKEMFEDEHDVVLPSGNTVRLHFSVAVVHERDGELVGFVVQMQDVTERHRLEEERATLAEQLVRSNQELEEFASVASHDLQEPLRKIRAFSDRLVSRHAERLGDAVGDLVRIQDAAARMQVLIDDVLAYSRVDRRPVGFAAVDLAELMAATTAEFQEQLDSVGGTLRPGKLPVIDGDGGELRQLFENLLSNAIKFRRPDEPLRIEVFEDDSLSNGGESVVVFADNGIGFEDQYAEKVFSIFKRLHGRSEYPGTGIGLAICRKIVGRHAGTIRAMATLGDGARFVIAFPRSNGGVGRNGAADA